MCYRADNAERLTGVDDKCLTYNAHPLIFLHNSLFDVMGESDRSKCRLGHRNGQGNVMQCLVLLLMHKANDDSKASA